jgi:hypothetical protein
MKLQVPFIQLPLLFDAPALAAEVDALGESAWRPHPNALPGNSMLPLVSANGDAADESFSGPMRPTPELHRCPYLNQTIAAITATVGRTRLMRLAGRAEVNAHVDQGYYWAERVRVHIPIITQPTVRFECGGTATHMAAGECWIFDTWRLHRVLNESSASRIHLVIDTVGSGDFWKLVAQGKPHNALADERWQPRRYGFGDASVADFACESINVPEVMSPWEINTHLGQLFGDAVDHPALPLLRLHSQRFLREWRGLWARFGEHPEGRSHFRYALEQFVEEVRAPGEAVFLRNNVTWYSAMTTLVAMVAVRGDRPLVAGEYALADRA